MHVAVEDNSYPLGRYPALRLIFTTHNNMSGNVPREENIMVY